MPPFTITTDDLSQVSADALVVLHTNRGMLGKSRTSNLQSHIDAYQRALAAGTTRAEWFCTLPKDPATPCNHLLLDSATFGPWMPGTESLKTAAARAIEIGRRYSLTKFAFACTGPDPVNRALAILEGALLGDFTDTRFRSAPDPRPNIKITIVCDPKHASAVRKALTAHIPVIEGTNLARRLVNAPNNVLTPRVFAEEARTLARKHANLQCTILNSAQLRKQGYGLITAVGAGSNEPPCLITLRYTPSKRRKNSPHVALVGKGVCFDTGGISIKPAPGMHTMNGDMGGAAAVIGAMRAIAATKPPFPVTAIIPAVINAVDGSAYLPGAIITSKSGKTVYIDNTDAEGRLILADAFTHAGILKADIILDFATLTGAAGVALGTNIAALFTDDTKLRDAILSAGDTTGDSVWQLPLWKEYDPSLDNNLADVCNTSTMARNGGAIHAANFLQRFVPQNTRWAHLDMSGAARAKNKTRYYNAGATGWGVRLITQTLNQL